MMKSVIVSSLIGMYACIVAACHDNPTKRESAIPTIPVVQPDTALLKWELTTKYSVDFWKEAVDSMLFIPLETNEHSLLGQVSHVQKSGDKLLVVDQWKAQKMLVFDMQGHFLYAIGGKGEGPGEYTALSDVLITPREIYVIDLLLWKFLCFDWMGHLLSEQTFTDTPPFTLVPVDGNRYIGSQACDGITPFHLTWVDADGRVVDTALPVRHSHQAPAGRLLPTLDGSMLFYHELCDTVYRIGADCLIPEFRLGLYEPEEVDDFLLRTKEMDEKEYLKYLFNFKDGKIVNLFSLLESANYWIVGHQKGSGVYLSVVDKRSNRCRNYVRSDLSQKRYYIPFSIRNTSEDWLCTFIEDSFINILPQSDQDRFIDHVESPDVRQMLRNYNFEERNPIICLFHLK